MTEYFHNLALLTAAVVATGSLFAFTSAVVYLIPEQFRSGWPLAITSPPVGLASGAYLVTFA